MNQKYLAPVLIFTIIVLALGGFLIYRKQVKSTPIPQQIAQPSLIKTDETANWKTYTNDQYGFSFKYPDRWIQTQVDGVIKIEENNKKGPTYQGLQITIYENVGNLSALEFLDKFFYEGHASLGYKQPVENYLNSSQLTPILLDKRQATKIEELLQPTGSGGIGVWLINKNNGIFLRSYPVSGGEVIFDQILSTFKFLDNNPEGLTCPLNGWQNCMPILTEEAKKGCGKEAIDWYKANCPNFQGIAR